MDPGLSLFQGEGININNEQNFEEAEDIEEQTRRREELQNLLTNALDDFKYDDSTINSSTNISMASVDMIEKNYRDIKPDEQLKALYDVRVREINDLRDELDGYKEVAGKEIETLKKRLTISEAEVNHVQMSLKNAQSLLVEKTDSINILNKQLAEKEAEIVERNKKIEKLNIDVYAANSLNAELQHKLQMEAGKFNLASRKYNAEELQKAHMEQILKLESVLEEQKQRSDYFEKEKNRVEIELKNVVNRVTESETINNETINSLSSNLLSAQEQCKDLIQVIEAFSKESEHYKERVQELESTYPMNSTDSFQKSTLDKSVILQHNERLQKMLVDKDMELTTLKAKQKFYTSDLKQLVEYQRIKSNSYFQKDCNNPEHYQKFVIMQNEFKNYEKQLIDKDQQLTDLNMVNKELREKIEEMLQQTRNDIQNLSFKYNLPKLESMSEELKYAENKVVDLKEEIKRLENENSELKLKLSEITKALDHDNSLKVDNKQLLNENNKLQIELLEYQTKLSKMEDKLSETEIFQKQLNDLTKEVNDLNKSMQTYDEIDLKQEINDICKAETISKEVLQIKGASWMKKINCLNAKMTENITDLSSKLNNAETKLKEYERNIHNMEETLQSLKNAQTMLEGENCNLQSKLQESEHLNEKYSKEINNMQAKLTQQLENQTEESQNKELEINKELVLLKSSLDSCKKELDSYKNIKTDLVTLKEELAQKNALLNSIELDKKQFERELSDARDLLDKYKEMERKHSGINSVKRSLTAELLSPCTPSDTNKKSTDSEQTIKDFQAEILKSEVILREQVRQEHFEELQKIEEKYKAAVQDYQRKLDQFKSQESIDRQKLSQTLKEWAEMISPLEQRNVELVKHISELEKEHIALKNYVSSCQQKYIEALKVSEDKAQKAIQGWQSWAKQLVKKALNIEKLNTKSRNTILNSLDNMDSQVASIDKYFHEKMKECKQKHRSVTK